MADTRYDAIVVGARCAGAPTAMLLARRGHKVLVVDRATFPSDTVSTHLLHPPGVASLRRWGLLERLEATGCPPIDTYAFDFGPFTISGAPGTEEAPRGLRPPAHRARQAAGGRGRRGRRRGPRGLHRPGRGPHRRARHRHPWPGSPRPGRHRAGPGGRGRRRAPLARGPGGRARAVPRAAPAAVRLLQLLERAGDGRPLRDLGPPRPRLRRLAHPRRPDPGHRRLAVRRAGANRDDVEGNFLAMLEMAPASAARLRAATREERFVGTAVPNYFRRPYGPGWALVGDAGYNRDLITAQGMHDAFRDAELCATALDEAFSGTRAFEDAMADYQLTRDRQVLPMYELTCQFAILEPPQPELQQLLGAVHGNQEAMDAFARVMAGVTSSAEFFSEQNVDRILARA